MDDATRKELLRALARDPEARERLREQVSEGMKKVYEKEKRMRSRAGFHREVLPQAASAPPPSSSSPPRVRGSKSW